MFFLSRGCCGKDRTKRTTAITASLIAAIVGVATSFLAREVKDGEPPREFPWLVVGLAAVAIVGLVVLALVKWRRSQEEP